ncbi:MAG: isoprenylcysteine carboxylmethyltransferase family protein [Spirochaetia bacterium]|jgi:protein-S-isoprenylcysteine O-methyltransferase Ste14
MNPNEETTRHSGRGYLVGGLALVYFIAALEILIMISPFAFFFYSVFNPILLGLNASVWTRWLTAFFLPHMIVPPTPLLVTLRVLGSILFIAGTLVFLICAAQVYLGKILKWGAASRGLYALVRHPQYTGLAMAGIGLTILWPRFLTLMFLAVMTFLYYLLAGDEERRMLRRYGDGYRTYLERTGMFLPRVSARLSAVRPLMAWKILVVLVALLGGAAIVGFGLRAYTVAHLPITNVIGIDAMSILPGDLPLAENLIADAQSDPRVVRTLRTMQATPADRVLAYIVPVNYIMQGMIADTAPEWRLFQRHQTLAMISDYVVNPMGHLQGGHMGHTGAMMHDSAQMQRRIIFVQISGKQRLGSAAADFGINAQRTPRFFVDVSLHTNEVLQVHDTPSGTGWGEVPTPMF